MEAAIRPFETGDYAAMCDVQNAAMPEYPVTEVEARHYDDTRDPRCRHVRYVAEEDGCVVGVATMSNMEWLFDVHKAFVQVTVRPEHQGRGIGAALYDTLWREAERWEAVALRGGVREDMTRACRFFKDRGFEEEMRAFESRLDVTAFDFAPFEGAIERVQASGIQLLTLRQAMDNPGHERAIWEMDVEVSKDIPMPEPGTEMQFEVYQDKVFRNPDLLPDAFFLARHEGRYVGVSQLWRSPVPDTLNTGLTGVRRDYRRRGIALALKLCAVRYAMETGIHTIRTDNATQNRPMLSINEALGYVKQPAWICLVKKVER